MENSPSNIALTVPLPLPLLSSLSKLVVSLGLGSLPSEVNADLAIRANVAFALWLGS